jgi:hypothetical protein
MRTLLSLTIGAVLLLALGCSDQSSSPVPTAVTTLTEGETPAAVTTLLESNTPDAFETAPTEGESWTAWPPYEVIKNSDVYAVTILWGQLQNAITPGMPVTDWSGRLWVNGVSVVQARRTIDFEPGEDSLLTEGDTSAVMWVSQTAVDFDGISFLIFLRRDIIYITAPTLHFETTPLTLDFTFGELAKLDKFYLLSSGNAAAIHARQIWPNRCTGGFMEGKWIKDDNTGSTGRITGVWLAYNGEPASVIAGSFWTNADGTREYSGYISGYFLTVVIAEFKGKWWYDDPRMCALCGMGHGWFRGTFKYANNSNNWGFMTGEFGDYLSPEVSALELPYVGVWSNFCDWTPESTDYSSDLGQ